MYRKIPLLLCFSILFPVALPAHGQLTKGKPIEVAVLDNQGNTFQNRDWLQKWLSGPLPGQPETSHKPMQEGSIFRPVPRSQKVVPNRNPDTGRPRDAGKEVINIGDGDITMSLFAGYQYWTENYRAYGAFNRLTNTTSVSDSVAVIENLVEWNSIRLGAISTYKPNDRLEWMFDFALIPYTSMYNEDSHLLRTSAADLGPAPNIIMEGSGFGYELALGMTYSVTPRIAAVLDFRYWSLMSEGDVTFGPNTASPSVFPLNDLDSFRYGINGGVRYSF